MTADQIQKIRETFSTRFITYTDRQLEAVIRGGHKVAAAVAKEELHARYDDGCYEAEMAYERYLEDAGAEQGVPEWAQ